LPELLTLEAALERILEHAKPLPIEMVPIGEAHGRVVREPARATVDLPPFPSSAMDGFAVRASETPGELPVAFRVAAGDAPPGALPPRAAAGIATGGTVPDEADAVVPVELVEDRGDHVVISAPAAPAQHVRPRGGDVHEGDVVVTAGTRLGAAQIGALAAAGIPEVGCSVRPRVVVLATGSELRPSGETLGPGEIYESNRSMIAAALAGSAEVAVLPVVEDDAEAHRVAIARGLEADVLVTSGGVSVGPHDLVRRIAAELGVEEVFWGVAVKPGKPLAFGVHGETLVFGLPGNPVSSLVGALLFVRPALLARQGLVNPAPTFSRAQLASALRQNVHRDEFIRAKRVETTDGPVLEAILGQESHMIARAAAADALIHVPRGDGVLPDGASVRYLSLD
jgi:molybdopterin molybdotransferase